MKDFRVNSTTYHDICDHIHNNKKILAIKTLRTAAACGLKEAKMAIDMLCIKLDPSKQGTNQDYYKRCPRILTGPTIMTVKLDYGDGPVELDIEGMQLRALTELQRVGLHACKDMLGLVDIFIAISEGKEVTISEDIK